MIRITLDEAYIFDILSIYDIKRRKLNANKLLITENRFHELSNEISSQIGFDKFDKIINSKEYKKMCEVNLKVFNLVDKAKIDTGLAKIIDDANFERYSAKVNLQNQFFDESLTEIKNRDY